MLFISTAVRQVKGLAHTLLQKWVLCLFTCSPNDPRDSYSRDSQDLWEEQHWWQAGFLRWCDSPSVFFSPLSCWRVSKWQDPVLGLPPQEWGGPGQRRGGGRGSGPSSSLLSQQDLRLLPWLSPHFPVVTAPNPREARWLYPGLIYCPSPILYGASFNEYPSRNAFDSRAVNNCH